MVTGHRSVLLPQERLREYYGGRRSGDILSLDLGCNRILRRFELAVDFIELGVLPLFLHKALTSISSAHFSEFSLLLSQGLLDSDLNIRDGNVSKVWGSGWEVVDKDLYAHAVRRDDFRFTVEIVVGQTTVAAVGAHFPRMKLKGSLVVTQRRLPKR